MRYSREIKKRKNFRTSLKRRINTRTYRARTKKYFKGRLRKSS